MIYKTEDGQEFKIWKDAEAHEKSLMKKPSIVIRPVPTELELRKMVYKNLFEFIQKKYAFELDHTDILNFLVNNKKEIMLLLTNGNLDTIYRAPRSFEKS